MAKKKFDINKRSRPMSEIVAEFEGEVETIEAIDIFEKDPSIKNKESVIEALNKDSKLTFPKQKLLSEINTLFMNVFSTRNLPTTYSELKKEIKYLADLHQVSGLFLGQRLIVVRDTLAYKEDGYSDLKSFIENETSISLRTAYDYIDINEQFISPYNLNSQTEINIISNNKSKLLPFIPLMKSVKLGTQEKEELRKYVIDEIESKSYRQLTQEAKDLKVQYNISKQKDIKPKTKSLTDTLTEVLEDIGKLSHKKANDAFLLIVDNLYSESILSESDKNVILEKFSKYIV